MEALRKYETKDIEPEILGKLYDDLGNLYLNQSLYDKALGVFQKEYELDKKTNDPCGLSFSLRNLYNRKNELYHS